MFGAVVHFGVFPDLLHVLLFDALKSETISILLKELIEFFFLVKAGGGELETPMGRVRLLQGSLGIVSPPIVNADLVVVGLVKGPGVLFVQPVINHRHTRIGWIREE